MKNWFVALIVSCGVLISGCGSAEPDMAEWLEKGVLIDTRTLEEYNSGHAPNALLVPYDTILSEIATLVPNKETPVILYCRSGRRAGIAEKELKANGYENVINVGGLADIKAFLTTYGNN